MTTETLIELGIVYAIIAGTTAAIAAITYAMPDSQRERRNAARAMFLCPVWPLVILCLVFRHAPGAVAKAWHVAWRRAV